jgi:hypothetical protein
MILRKCCGTIGYEVGTMLLAVNCFPCTGTILNLQADVTRLAECDVVFAGNNSTCGISPFFLAADWAAVKTYIEGGGRLFLAGEYEGCLSLPANFNAFLAALGSTITWVGGLHNIGCSTTGTRDMVAGPANIAQGLTTPIRMGLTAELAGGTTVFFSPDGVPMLQVEAIGAGFLFVVGDGNVAGGGCLYNQCEFFERLLTYEDGDII